MFTATSANEDRGGSVPPSVCLSDCLCVNKISRKFMNLSLRNNLVRQGRIDWISKAIGTTQAELWDRTARPPLCLSVCLWVRDFIRLGINFHKVKWAGMMCTKQEVFNFWRRSVEPWHGGGIDFYNLGGSLRISNALPVDLEMHSESLK